MALPTDTSAQPATPTIRGLPRPLARELETYASRLDVDRIREAYTLAEEAHRGQKRASGESFVSHAVEVTIILGQLRMDTDSLVAGLIHDVVEDTVFSLPDVEARFGGDVAAIVDGVTKIGKVEFRSHTERQAENYRKLLLSMAEDARVILIKLADRLHNMRTLEYLPRGKQQRIAQETREIYAPLAHRLGIAQVKWELEDLCFKYLETEEYEELQRLVQQRRQERERQILEMQRPIEDLLREAGIPFEVTGRPKHLWSIYRKIDRRGKPYEEIYDLMAMRVITDSVQNCYAALGLIHSKFTPIQDRFHDYIATPKSNMYRSLHTTVFGPHGRRYEIQLRTEEMHRTAEYGIAAHWRYKEGGEKSDEVDEALSWFRQVLEWQQDASEPEEFMEFLKMDLFLGEIFIFTPKGEVKQLPTGATPIDFAFAVHTEVGFHCAGARVNGRIAPLSRELKNGDTVEVITSTKQTPSRDWLSFVKTSRARQKVRQWIRQEEHEQSVKLGKEFLDRELKKLRVSLPVAGTLAEVAEALDFPDWEHVYAGLGRGDVGPSAVIKELFPEEEVKEAQRKADSPLQRIAKKIRGTDKGVRIQGLDNLMVRYSQCCQPVPGDDVIGYITAGRGVSIHRKDCPNVLNLSREPDRRVEIEWTAEQGDRFFVKLYTRGTDRRGLLSDIAKAITDTGTDIQHADIRAIEDGMLGEFVVEVPDLQHLNRVMKGISRVKGVVSVERRESFGESDLLEGGSGRA
ncbi:MAG: bifunctional (p)ppGpp synthetase/guanosine-3',5'-bis(diphosphate) 3'-pyrophosphohydrolase [Gemmatimonadales bacterium]|nr:MAG: bifunctional (p)ppGpp synthetase/guanosine-3',5'-bis(diphosphate) 3'-pyrophosphohydrolase [Gemmatimonadales bacterium]